MKKKPSAKKTIEDAVLEIISKEKKVYSETDRAIASLTATTDSSSLDALSSIVSAISPHSSTVIDTHDPMDEKLRTIIKEVVLDLLQEERVLVAIGGKAKPYNKSRIAISKSDTNLSDIKVEKETELLKEFDIMEELEKIR